jgi:hypothetical protein
MDCPTGALVSYDLREVAGKRRLLKKWPAIGIRRPK